MIELKKVFSYNVFLSGHSSVVERLVANEKVEGSTPFARSKFCMSELLDKKCVPCEGGIEPFDVSEIHKYQKKVDGWDVVKGDKNKSINQKTQNYRKFLFD